VEISSVALEAFVQQHFLSLLVGYLGLVFLLILWGIPKWQASRVQDLKERLTLENAARQTLAQILGGALLLVGLYFTAETLQTTQEGQITDRFTKAINQLGESGVEKLAIRLGGIYGLERIAKDSEKDYWPIMEILTTYVKYHANWSFVKDEDRSKDYLRPPDIQAILTVIGRRTRTFRQGEDHRLSLMDTDLRNATLFDANLKGALLIRAHLEGAILERARLQGAYLAQTASRFPFRWCGMKPTLSDISQLDAPPGLHSAQEEALDASEPRYANPRGYADPIQSASVRTGVNKIMTRFALQTLT
jgi:Pentapeptide repeats (8 copies)